VADDLLTLAEAFVIDPPRDKFRLLIDLAKRAAATLGIKPGSIRGPLIARESIGSTAVGNGIALPHAAVEGLPSNTVLLAKLERPIAFDAPDGRPVDIVVVLLVPPGSPDTQVRALSRLVTRLRNAEMVNRLRAAKDPETAHAAFTEAGSDPSRPVPHL
jgi:PTS system nitrogen regulatory IIA component